MLKILWKEMIGSQQEDRTGADRKEWVTSKTARLKGENEMSECPHACGGRQVKHENCQASGR